MIKLTNSIALIAINLCFACIAFSQAGSLDSDFGVGGTQTVALSPGAGSAHPRDSVIQSDGKIVTLVTHYATSSMLIRLNADGSLDGGFGTGGIVTSTWLSSGNSASPGTVSIQTVLGEEKLIVAGRQNVQQGRKTVSMLRLDRYDSNGAIDPTFGVGGSLVINNPQAYTAAVDASQNILIGDAGGYVLRLHPDGTIDSSFGTNGKTFSGLRLNELKVLYDGRILASGSFIQGSTTLMGVTRLNANGSIDTGFGSNGRAAANFGNGSIAVAQSADMDASGKVAAGGWYKPKNSNSTKFAAARFTNSGQPDLTFNGSGRVLFDFYGFPNSGNSMVLQTDGKLVMSGPAQVSSGVFDFGIVRFNYDGSLDQGFGIGGFTITEVGGVQDVSSLVLPQPTVGGSCDKFVVIGSSTGGTSFARYNCE